MRTREEIEKGIIKVVAVVGNGGVDGGVYGGSSSLESAFTESYDKRILEVLLDIRDLLAHPLYETDGGNPPTIKLFSQEKPTVSAKEQWCCVCGNHPFCGSSKFCKEHWTVPAKEA